MRALRAFVSAAKKRLLSSRPPRWSPGAWRLFLILPVLLLGLSEPTAAEEAEDAAASAPSREATEARRAEIAALVSELRDAPAADPKRLALLERLERVLTQTLDEAARGEEITAQLDASRATPARPVADQLGHAPPYSVAEYDVAVEKLAVARRVLSGLKEAIGEAASSLEAARKALEDAERKRRAALESPETSEDAAVHELRVEVAEAELALRRRQVEDAHRALEAQEAQVARLRDAVAWAGAQIAPKEGEREARAAELDAEIAMVSRRREQAELQLQSARRRWERLTSRGASEQAGEAALRAEAAARRAEFAAYQKQVALLGEQIEHLERARVLLQRRFAVFAAERPARSELAKWDDESSEALRALERELRLDRAEQAAFVQELRTLEGSLGEEPERGWQERQIQALRDTVAAYDANAASLDASRRREEQLQRSLEPELGKLNLRERAAQIGSLLADVWRFEVTSSEDRSITVGKIATGLLVFAIGLLVARGFTHWFGPRVLNRARVDEGAAHAYQSLGYYVLLAIAFITALRIVDIPLTAFAVVGGALAIGVGFGSQNVVSNFISGLILLAERPIKRGDLVELAGTYGNIERIGLRSTRVRTGDNVHVIVPNSAFLENNVVNWTHNDRQVRIRVTVGVVYGSPTREVAKLIQQAVTEHPKVLEKPDPIVLFTEFGDNSLNFEVRFWVVIRRLLERLRIESEIRFRIDDLFREADIVIAFPQRDVHLDAVNPIPVRLLNGADSTEKTN